LTSAKLFGVCLRILPDRNHAEEALQETYLSIWRRAGTFDSARGTAMTWLMTLARNCAVDRHRVLARSPQLPMPETFEIADPDADLFAATLAEDERRQLHACLGQLEEMDRSFLVAAFFEGSSYPELAGRVAMPLPTVKSRIRRALLKLRGCLS
jgi:RNA polymerase sigma-70 factor (ECF subfamily)